MTQDEIIEMARQAGLVSPYRQYKDWIEAGPSGEELMDFAKLVAAKEREACIALCDGVGTVEQWDGLSEAADRIRARGEA
jgi:hypothetical protein